MDDSVLDMLTTGNERFVRGEVQAIIHAASPSGEYPPHRPLAIVVACSDARVPVERVFDQPAGALFVVRVAGHVLEPASLASVHFAVEQLGARVVVVLGHQACGAVTAALGPDRPEPLAPLIDPIRRRLSSTGLGTPPTEEDAVRANVVATIAELKEYLGAAAPAPADEVLLVGAVHSFATGRVTWLE